MARVRRREPGTKLRVPSSEIGLVGRISPWKGQHIFIRAAALVHQRFREARFFIIGAALFGEDQYEQEIRRLPGELGIEGIVEFSGFRSDVKQAIAELDLVVHASTQGEPFGQVIIEGMAAGKPVVATDGGGVPEIVEDGHTGILVPMGNVQAMADAICQILAHPVTGPSHGRSGAPADCQPLHTAADRTASRGRLRRNAGLAIDSKCGLTTLPLRVFARDRRTARPPRPARTNPPLPEMKPSSRSDWQSAA